METVAARTYKVNRAEFPLSVMIVPKDATGNAATTVIVGHIREVKNGVELDERDADITDGEGVISYAIAAPQNGGSLDIIQTLLGFFASTEPDQARFEITISTSGGQKTKTAIRNPDFNPGTANLKFQI